MSSSSSSTSPIEFEEFEEENESIVYLDVFLKGDDIELMQLLLFNEDKDDPSCDGLFIKAMKDYHENTIPFFVQRTYRAACVDYPTCAQLLYLRFTFLALFAEIDAVQYMVFEQLKDDRDSRVFVASVFLPFTILMLSELRNVAFYEENAAIILNYSVSAIQSCWNLRLLTAKTDLVTSLERSIQKEDKELFRQSKKKKKK